MVRTRGIGHIHLVVSDIDRSLRFYQKVFGVEEAFRTGPKMIFANLPGTEQLITLHEKPDENGDVDHVGFQFADNDLDIAIKEVEQAGGRLVEQGEHAPGIPYAYLADPDGNVFELS